MYTGTYIYIYVNIHTHTHKKVCIYMHVHKQYTYIYIYMYRLVLQNHPNRRKSGLCVEHIATQSDCDLHFWPTDPVHMFLSTSTV